MKRSEMIIAIACLLIFVLTTGYVGLRTWQDHQALRRPLQITGSPIPQWFPTPSPSPRRHRKSPRF